MQQTRRVADAFDRLRRPFAHWRLRGARAQRGASDSALHLLHGLALVSLAAAVPGLITAGPDGSVLGPLGAVVLVASWSVRHPRPRLRVLTDALEALAVLGVALGMEETWQAVAIVLAALWYRSLRSTGWEVVARIALYTTAVAGESAITGGGLSWDDAGIAFAALPFWVGTAIVAKRMGLMLLDHDAVSEIVAIEATLSADVMGEVDTATLAKLARASWHDLAETVPGLRIVRMELHDKRLLPIDRAGTWRHMPPPVQIGSTTTPCLWDRLAAAPPGLQPRLDTAAGEPCRWGLGPQLDSGGLGRVLIGVPADVSPRVVTAITSALERTELVQQHARDHVLLGVQARTDDLTGLANRFAFFDTLAELGALGAPLSLLFLDLDGFKEVNDTHGHAVGDQVLHRVAVRLLNAGAGAASVARLGGDEFAVLYQGADANLATGAGHQAEAALAQPVATTAGPIRVGVSWGVSMVEDGNVAELLARADAQMYRTKRSHRAAASRDRRARR